VVLVVVQVVIHISEGHQLTLFYPKAVAQGLE
jgi:hypothetical protein